LIMRLRAAVVAVSLAIAGSISIAQLAVSPAAAHEKNKAEVALISPAELAALIEQGKVVLIDVRTPTEFDEVRLHGALNAPLQTFDPATIPMEDDRETILYCRSSGRSGRAATILADHIGGKVRHMEGGILAWQEAGLPTIPAPKDTE
jgi:rhodanese-related sulfurtransferase